MTVYEEVSQVDREELRRLAERISERLACVVLGLGCYRSDVTYYVLCDRGSRLDTYDSCPEYEDTPTPEARAAVRGRPDVLVDYSIASHDELGRILASPSHGERAEAFSFQEERVGPLARALGIDPQRATLSFEDVESGDAAATLPDAARWPRLTGRGLSTAQRKLVEAMEAKDVTLALSILRRGVDPNFRAPRGGLTPLTMAVAAGSAELVRALLDAGARLDTGLMAWTVAPEVLSLLRERGADIDEQSCFGRTALVAAVERRDRTALGWLLDSGAHVDARSDVRFFAPPRILRGRTPLMQAVESGDDSIVERLLDASADPDLADGEGRTALMLAAAGGRPQTVALLLARGSSRVPRDTGGLDALEHARAREREVIGRMADVEALQAGENLAERHNVKGPFRWLLEQVKMTADDAARALDHLAESLRSAQEAVRLLESASRKPPAPDAQPT